MTDWDPAAYHAKYEDPDAYEARRLEHYPTDPPESEPVKNHRDMYPVVEVIHHGNYRRARVVEVYELNETTIGGILESSAYCYGRMKGTTHAAELLSDLKRGRVNRSIGWSTFRVLAPGEEPR